MQNGVPLPACAGPGDLHRRASQSRRYALLSSALGETLALARVQGRTCWG